MPSSRPANIRKQQRPRAVSTTSEKADEALEQQADMLLSSENYEFFLGALDEGNPSERSHAAAGRYHKGRREG